MKAILRPEPIVINGQSITFDAFVRDALCDPRFGVDLASVRLARSILDALERSFGAEPVSIRDAEWSALVDVVEKPTRSYDPRMAVHMIAFFDAVLNAASQLTEPAR